MESEHLKGLKEEATVLRNRMDVMTDKSSEQYQYVTARLMDVTRMMKDETERLNSIEKSKQDAERLEIEREKIELEGERARLAQITEEEKIRQQKKSNRWQVTGKILEAALAIGVNTGTAYLMLRANNSGEALTSQEQKFIFPKRLK